MREEEVAAGGIMMRYTNHSVKQDLAKLDNKDVENRNTALCSLKQLVVQLDAITLSRFLNQVLMRFLSLDLLLFLADLNCTHSVLAHNSQRATEKTRTHKSESYHL